MKKTTIEFIIKALTIASFFIPIVVVPSSFIFPFIVPKILLIRTAVVFLVALYSMLLLINFEAYKPPKTVLTLALFAFGVSFLISTFVGVDAYHSFWDNHERMLGLFTVTHYILLFVVLSSVNKTWADWRLLARWFLVAGSVVMFVGLLQVGNPNLLLNQGSERVASTLGNSIYVGSYGLFLLALAVLLYVRESVLIWKWVELVGMLLALGGMVFSGARGSMLGLAAGVVAALVLYSFAFRGHRQLRTALLCVLGASFVITGILYINRNGHFVKSVPALDRVFSTTISGIANSPRAIAWQVAFESWQERPVFGWGPNNFFYAFNKYYKSRSLEFGYGETWFDNAHNIILNTLSVQGLVGLLAYLSIFVTGIVLLARSWRRGELNIHVFVIGSAFLIAHLVQDITVFEDPTSYLCFMFWLAMINSLCSNKPVSVDKAGKNVVENETVSSDRRVGVAPTLGIVGIAFIVNTIFNLQPALANMQTLVTIGKLSQDPIAALPDVATTFAQSSPHIDDIRNDVTRTMIEIVTNNYEKLGVEKSVEILTVAAEALQKNVILHPHDIRDTLLLGQLFQTAATITNKVEYMLQAEQYTQQALNDSLKRQQIIFGLASIKITIGKAPEAAVLLEQALKDDPKIAETYWRLMIAYRVADEDAKVKATFALAEQNHIVFDAQGQAIIKQILDTPLSTLSAKPVKGKK